MNNAGTSAYIYRYYRTFIPVKHPTKTKLTGTDGKVNSQSRVRERPMYLGGVA